VRIDLKRASVIRLDGNDRIAGDEVIDLRRFAQETGTRPPCPT
jgi:hypothetical protein